MFQHRSSYLVPFTSFFSEDDGKNPPVPPAKSEKPQFDDAQQKHINDLLAAERKSAEQRTEQRLTDEAAAAKKKADEDRERDEQAKRGEFDTIRGELEGKVTTAEEEAKTAETERDAAYELLKAQADELKADLPKELLDGFPDDGSPVAQINWLKDRKQVFETAKTAAGVTATNVTRLPQTPKSQGDPPIEARSLVSRHAI